MIRIRTTRRSLVEVSVVGDEDLRAYRDGGNHDPLWREAMEAFLADHPEAMEAMDRLRSLRPEPRRLN